MTTYAVRIGRKYIAVHHRDGQYQAAAPMGGYYVAMATPRGADYVTSTACGYRTLRELRADYPEAVRDQLGLEGR